MNESDFRHALCDDADDALARYAYADFLDERGESGASEFYRLSGDLIDAPADSVDADLIRARMEFVFRAAVRPRWTEAVRSVERVATTWREHRGLIYLGGVPVDLLRSFDRLAALLPLGGAMLTPAQYMNSRVDPDSPTWLRSVTLERPHLLPLLRDELPGVAAHLRELEVINRGEWPWIPTGDALPKLHRLQLDGRSAGGVGSNRWELGEFIGALPELRHLRLDGLASRSAQRDLLYLVAPSLRSLALSVVQGVGPAHVELPHLTHVELEMHLSVARGFPLDYTSQPGMFERAESVTVRIPGPVEQLAPASSELPVPPPHLKRLQVDITPEQVSHQTIVEAWGRHAEAFSLRRTRPDQGHGLEPLLESDRLRDLVLDGPGLGGALADLARSTLPEQLESLCVGHVIDAEVLTAFASAQWPRLRRLELRLPRESSAGLALESLCRSGMLSTLEVLRLRLTSAYSSRDRSVRLPDDFADHVGPRLRLLEVDGDILSNAVVGSLIDSELPAQLDVLHVRTGYHSDRFAEPLRDAFPQLRFF